MRSGLVEILLLASLVAPLTSQAVPTRPIAPTPQSRLTAQLRANDERLLTAVHAGGREVWTQFTTEDFIYVEEGTVLTRAELLAELVPDGYEAMRIRTFEVHKFGDFALVVHTDDVPEDRRNIRPTGHFLMTETWQRLAGVWKLHIVHVDAVRTDPPAVPLTDSQQDELTGTYNAGGRNYTIRRTNGSLLGSLEGAPPMELEAETRDILFLPGETRLRRVFLRDITGKVTGFFRRGENTDILWTRVGPS